MIIAKNLPVTCEDCIFKYNKGIEVDAAGHVHLPPPAPTNEKIDEANAVVVGTDDATGVTRLESQSGVQEHSKGDGRKTETKVV